MREREREVRYGVLWVKRGGREWYTGEGEKRKTKVSINGRGLNVMCGF